MSIGTADLRRGGQCVALVLVMWLVTWLSAAPACGEVAPATMPADAMTRLVESLGSRFEKVAAGAEALLIEMGPAAKPALEAATTHADPEVSQGVKRLLARLPRLSYLVVDALGRPIPHAQITIKVQRGQQRRVSTDERGQVMSTPQDEEAEAGLPVQVTHARYGTAVVGPVREVRNPVRILYVPLLNGEEPEIESAVRGTVVDADGKAVANAQVCCQTAAGSDKIMAPSSPPHVLTDAAGRFAIAPTRAGPRPGVPPAPHARGERFYVTVFPPEGAQFFLHGDEHTNAEPIAIRLGRGTRPRTFEVEVKPGQVVAADQVEGGVTVTYRNRPDGRRIHVPGWMVKHGGWLMPGTYEAFVNGRRFPAITMDEGTPGAVRFDPGGLNVFRGRVISAIDGKPIWPALVLGIEAGRQYEGHTSITAEQWKAFREVNGQVSELSPELNPWVTIFNPTFAVRTTSDGSFVGEELDAGRTTGVVALAENMMPVMLNLRALGPRRGNQLKIGDFPMVPSATVIVRPILPANAAGIGLWCTVDPKDRPAWFTALTMQRNERTGLTDSLKPNVRGRAQVMAGVKTRVSVSANFPLGHYAPTLVKDAVELRQGEELDLGDVTVLLKVPVQLRVVDEAGQPLAGITFYTYYGDEKAGYGTLDKTDKDGLCTLKINPHTTGKVRIAGPRPDEKGRWPEVLFKIADKPPDGGPLKFVLTPAWIEAALNRK